MSYDELATYKGYTIKWKSTGEFYILRKGVLQDSMAKDFKERVKDRATALEVAKRWIDSNG